MNALRGTGRLLRLNLRIDRVKLPIWIIANVSLIALTIPQLLDAYPSESARGLYAVATSSSIVSRLLGGALTGPSIGEITVVETYLLAALLIALMNIFLISRHTRQNEESNRSEVIGSALVGRQASLTAALLLAFIANTITASLIFLVYRLNDLPTSGALLYSTGLFMLGLTFAGVSAITSQLVENTRTANGLAGLVFGIAFMLRAVGDALGTLLPGGLGVQTNFLSWLSPLGWVTNSLPFNNERWWVLGIFCGLVTALVSSAYILLSRRDVGAGLFAPKRSKLHASPLLLKRFGLAWRLNHTSTISWTLALIVAGAALGGVAHEFADLIAANEEMQRILSELSQSLDITKLMFGATFAIIGIAATGYALQILARMRSEESDGRLELTLSTSRSRQSWLLTNVVYVFVTSIFMLLAAGFSAGLVFGIIDNTVWSSIWELSTAILVYIPALGVLIGATLVLFGRFPRNFSALVWAMLAFCLLVFQLGVVLDLPQWLINLSPFAHTPAAPAVDVKLKPLAMQLAVALGLGTIGFVLFKRRDIASS